MRLPLYVMNYYMSSKNRHNMKKIIFYLFFSLIASTLSAVEMDSSVIFKASFLKNELQSYQISRGLYTIKKADTTSFERIKFNADIYVKDSTENYYLLNWRFSKFSINTDDQQLTQLIALAKPVEISCRISKVGVFMEFLDGEKVSACLEEALPVVLAQFANKKSDADKAQVARIYDLRETMETLMLRSIIQFHQVYGLGYKLDEVVDVPTEVNSRFSSTPIKGIIRKKLTKIDTENNIAVLSTATFLDTKEFQKAFKEYLHIGAIPESSLNQENMGSIVMDLSTGWVLWTFDQRETKVGNEKYGEQIEIQHINDVH